MSRFFQDEEFQYSIGEPLPEQVTLSGEDAFHLSVSLRARIGDEVELCTADGIELLCRIKAISGGKKDPLAILVPVSARRSEVEMPMEVTLFQGMPKGKKTDSIIQKCTELGVSRIVFVYTDHAVPELSDEEKKLARFRKIAEEACKQCGRAKLVKLAILPNLESAVEQMQESDLAFACYEKEQGGGLKELLRRNVSSVSFLIGPEGGISPREAELLKKSGIPTVTLGKRILRTETAGSAVMSMLVYEKEL
ncbi:MAG: 16S rRNA (uracil(1498)-N(3))-methyltransferase [Clostridia bacterium]|nr:16S rRNA (uracil(1498)-N(3))-methyltransferase [Clostridia bacterium]